MGECGSIKLAVGGDRQQYLHFTLQRGVAAACAGEECIAILGPPRGRRMVQRYRIGKVVEEGDDVKAARLLGGACWREVGSGTGIRTPVPWLRTTCPDP